MGYNSVADIVCLSPFV